MTKKSHKNILVDEKTFGKKGHQKFWRMNRLFWVKVTWKSVTCEIFLDSLNTFLKSGGGMLHCLRGDGCP